MARLVYGIGRSGSYRPSVEIPEPEHGPVAPVHLAGRLVEVEGQGAFEVIHLEMGTELPQIAQQMKLTEFVNRHVRLTVQEIEE